MLTVLPANHRVRVAAPCMRTWCRWGLVRVVSAASGGPVRRPWIPNQTAMHACGHTPATSMQTADFTSLSDAGSGCGMGRRGRRARERPIDAALTRLKRWRCARRQASPPVHLRSVSRGSGLKPHLGPESKHFGRFCYVLVTREELKSAHLLVRFVLAASSGHAMSEISAAQGRI